MLRGARCPAAWVPGTDCLLASDGWLAAAGSGQQTAVKAGMFGVCRWGPGVGGAGGRAGTGSSADAGSNATGPWPDMPKQGAGLVPPIPLGRDQQKAGKARVERVGRVDGRRRRQGGVRGRASGADDDHASTGAALVTEALCPSNRSGEAADHAATLAASGTTQAWRLGLRQLHARAKRQAAPQPEHPQHPWTQTAWLSRHPRSVDASLSADRVGRRCAAPQLAHRPSAAPPISGAAAFIRPRSGCDV